MQLKPLGAKAWARVEIQHEIQQEILCNINFHSETHLKAVYKFLAQCLYIIEKFKQSHAYLAQI